MARANESYWVYGKTVIIKQGGNVREINRSHIVKVSKCGDYFGGKERDVHKEEEDNSEAETREEEGTWVAMRREGGDGSESSGESSEDEDGKEEQSETNEERDEAKVEEEGT